jgi:thiol-disulfide isomerase/thioredoxin
MKNSWLTILAILALTFTGSVLAAETAPLKPYQAGDWKFVIKTANNTPLAVHFWGVTCPACVKEMPQWGRFLKTYPNAKVVFIQVDDVSTDSIKKMLSKAGLENANNYYVVPPFDERIRYEIDPKWHGETPTTILIDAKGSITRKTGLINFKQLEKSLIGP